MGSHTKSHKESGRGIHSGCKKWCKSYFNLWLQLKISTVLDYFTTKITNSFSINTWLARGPMRFHKLIENSIVGGFKKWMNDMAARQVFTTISLQAL